MKKFLNRLSTSGKIDATSLKEESYQEDDEEHLDVHYRKPTALPADAKDTSQDLKLKKSFSSPSGSIGRSSGKDYDFANKKTSSNGIKKEKKDKEKLKESDDKGLRKSPRKKSISKSSEVKNPDSMRSPSLKGVFVSSYEHQRDLGAPESDESDNDEFVPHSDDDRDTDSLSTPIRVPSAPARVASSPVPAYSASPARASPRNFESTPPAFAATPPRAVYSPQAYQSPAMASPALVPALPRSVSSPNPSQAAAVRSPEVVAADDFEARFGGHARTNSTSDDSATALGVDFNSRNRSDSVADEEVQIADDVEATNQKAKSGLFSFGNKGKKLK